jgi:hypothetical protein
LERFYSAVFHYSKVIVLAAVSGPAQLSDFRKSSDKGDDRAAMDHAREIERIPIGESNATVRFGLADFFWRRRAVNTIARGGHALPIEARRLFAVDLALLVSLLFRESGPGLSHFDQQGLIRLIRSLPSQAKAFGRTPLVILEFGHGTLRLARNSADVTFVPSEPK